jgi:uncharacterized protein
VAAVDCYRRAADAGHAGALCNLGACYENGDGVAEDKAVAVDYYRRAVDAGHKAAHVNLGLCYSENIRVAVDKAAAQSFTVAPGTSPP